MTTLDTVTSPSGISASLGARTILLDMPANGTPTGVQTILDDELFFLLLDREPGLRDVNGPHINGIYAITFDADCELSDDELRDWIVACAEIVGLTGCEHRYDDMIEASQLDVGASDQPQLGAFMVSGNIADFTDDSDDNFRLARALLDRLDAADPELGGRITVQADSCAINVYCHSDHDAKMVDRHAVIALHLALANDATD